MSFLTMLLNLMTQWINGFQTCSSANILIVWKTLPGKIVKFEIKLKTPKIMMLLC